MVILNRFSAILLRFDSFFVFLSATRDSVPLRTVLNCTQFLRGGDKSAQQFSIFRLGIITRQSRGEDGDSALIGAIF